MASSNQRNTEFVMPAMDWMRDMTEQNLNQTRMMWEGFLTTARNSYEGLDQQASETRSRLLSLVQETLSNSFDLAHKIVHARGPQDLLQLESEFISRQAQLIAEHSKELGQNAVRGAQEAGRMASQGIPEASQRGAKAA
jgi:hypothetical protein